MMGVFSGAGGYAINKFGNELGRAGKIASSAVLGGMVSEIGGGKFANGAITAAYSMMFNEFMHEQYTKRATVNFHYYLMVKKYMSWIKKEIKYIQQQPHQVKGNT